MQWYRAAEDGAEFHALNRSSERFRVETTNSSVNLTILRVRPEDSGVYVCDSGSLAEEGRQPLLCGTELRVVGGSSVQQARSRSTLKDTIIIIQSVLLLVLIAVPALLFMDRVSNGRGAGGDRGVTERRALRKTTPMRTPLPPLGERCGVGVRAPRPRPAQGLEVEQMATYEDITPFRDVKAKWTVGEHPGEE
ncbi:hypothetical protein ASZ78_005828 [Callipepla squamata]|uniref:Ig-like domain-containing protein n=1 Tax=Callipepla squamata TaxID=9009 RepID=A0A226MK87_CALSU|nr:hypothetical protein ASZ78_005828 [Callipepla squamata]